jgi:hypothetical protein
MLDRLIPTERRRALVHRARTLRGEGRERLWDLETRALTRAEDLLERAEGLPVVSRVAHPVERLVSERLTAVTAPPIEDYDALNARNAALAVRGLGRVDLLKVRRHEQATKDRKTVYKAIDRELAHLEEEPEAAA